jgi:hypothetical protein
MTTLWQRTALSLILPNINVPEVSNIIIEYLSDTRSKEKYGTLLSDINQDTCPGCTKYSVIDGPWSNPYIETQCRCIGTKPDAKGRYYVGDYVIDGVNNMYRRCSLCADCWNTRVNRVMNDCPFCKRDITSWLYSAR